MHVVGVGRQTYLRRQFGDVENEPLFKDGIWIAARLQARIAAETLEEGSSHGIRHDDCALDADVEKMPDALAQNVLTHGLARLDHPDVVGIRPVIYGENDLLGMLDAIDAHFAHHPAHAREVVVVADDHVGTRPQDVSRVDPRLRCSPRENFFCDGMSHAARLATDQTDCRIEVIGPAGSSKAARVPIRPATVPAAKHPSHWMPRPGRALSKHTSAAARASI